MRRRSAGDFSLQCMVKSKRVVVDGMMERVRVMKKQTGRKSENGGEWGATCLHGRSRLSPVTETLYLDHQPGAALWPLTSQNRSDTNGAAACFSTAHPSPRHTTVNHQFTVFWLPNSEPWLAEKHSRGKHPVNLGKQTELLKS